MTVFVDQKIQDKNTNARKARRNDKTRVGCSRTPVALPDNYSAQSGRQKNFLKKKKRNS